MLVEGRSPVALVLLDVRNSRLVLARHWRGAGSQGGHACPMYRLH
jgi:hypothetical protein